LARQPFAPTAFDQVILGCVNVIADEMNPARVAALRLGMGEKMVAFTVQINCGSGMQSIDTAYRYIREGVSDLILAGGAEALSHAPLVWPQQGVRWFAGLAGAKGIGAKIMAGAEVKPSYFKPIIGLERGPDRSHHRTQYGADRRSGRPSLRRHPRAVGQPMPPKATSGWRRAQSEGWLKGEVENRVRARRKILRSRRRRAAGLDAGEPGKLKPVFERPWGKVTAGNSSQITDGASWVILASERLWPSMGLTPKAAILDSQWSALDPGIMGLGPVLSASELLKRNELTLCRYRDLGIERGVCDAGAGLSRRLER
jgi:acetyl-CoA C-acetyltransferase